jgi:hypothetical protein
VGGTKVLGGDNGCLDTVVEPPKFITQRHVAAVFEKLGYDPSCAHKVFLILVEAVSRIKTVDSKLSVSSGEDMPLDNTYLLASAVSGSPRKDLMMRNDLDKEANRSSMRKESASAMIIPPAPPISTPNAALAKAFGDFDDISSSMTKDSSNGKTVAGTGTVIPPPPPVDGSPAAIGATTSSSTAAAAIAPQSSSSSGKADPSASANTSSSSAAAGASAKMDFHDFVR